MYGVKMIGDKTEIAQTKKALQTTQEELYSCTNDNNSKGNKIEQLNKTITKQNNTILKQASTISQKESSISELQNTITELENRLPKVVTIYQDRTVYKDKPEPYHRFGKNYCKLLVYTTCTSGYIKVWFDGDYVGQLTGHYSSAPNCNSTDYTLYKTLTAGKHHIEAENTSTKSTWDFYVTISEDDCYRHGLTCK